MTTVDECLKQQAQPMPDWLPGDTTFSAELLRHFLTSRVAYYPGAGTDGRVFATFAANHAAHCIVHIDMTRSASEIQSRIAGDHADGLRGYRPATSQTIDPEEFSSIIPLSRGVLDDCEECLGTEWPSYTAYRNGERPKSVLWTVLQREAALDDGHGPSRIAFLHVQAEAVRFCRDVWKQFPEGVFGLLLQDHGFSCNWTRFGRGGALERVAAQTTFPRVLLVADNTNPWDGYEAVSDLTARTGGGRNRVFLRPAGQVPSRSGDDSGRSHRFLGV